MNRHEREAVAHLEAEVRHWVDNAMIAADRVRVLRAVLEIHHRALHVDGMGESDTSLDADDLYRWLTDGGGPRLELRHYWTEQLVWPT